MHILSFVRSYRGETFALIRGGRCEFSHSVRITIADFVAIIPHTCSCFCRNLWVLCVISPGVHTHSRIIVRQVLHGKWLLMACILSAINWTGTVNANHWLSMPVLSLCLHPQKSILSLPAPQTLYSYQLWENDGDSSAVIKKGAWKCWPSNGWLINGRGSFTKQSLGYKATLTLLTLKCKQWRLCGTIPTISAVARWLAIDRKCLREWDKNYDKLLAACFWNDKKCRNGQLGKRVRVRGYELSYFLLSTTNLLYCDFKKQLLDNTHYTVHYGLV